MHYVLSFDFDVHPKSELLSETESPDDIDVNFDAGVKIALSLPPVNLNRSQTFTEITPDLLPSYLSNFIISSNFRLTLARAGVANIDYYPTIIRGEDGSSPKKEYFVGNIIGRIACLDKERSIFDTMSGDEDMALDIEEMHLNYSAIGASQIFRLHEHPTIILVDEKVKQAIESDGLVGVKFSEAEGYCL